MKLSLLSLVFISSFTAVAAEQAPTEAPAIDPIAAVEQEVVKTLQEKILAYAKKSLGSSSHLVELGFGCYLAKLLHEDLKQAGTSVIGNWQIKVLFGLAAASFIKNSAEGLNDKLDLQLGQNFDKLTALVKRKLGRQAK